MKSIKWLGALLLGACLALSAHAQASQQLAPGFTQRPANSRIVLMPLNLELYSISAGGVPEPRADWTETARRLLRRHLTDAGRMGAVEEIDERTLDDFAELSALNGAVAQAIYLHHIVRGRFELPTKGGLMDWSLGDAVAELKARTGADYALFTWFRDSYASTERVAAIVVMALFGVGMAGGAQLGYASLVDLRNGRIVWFNCVERRRGDLREEESARETADALLSGFPARAKP